jgi:DNA-directed RNA polymerase specialized sigma24 family protein
MDDGFVGTLRGDIERRLRELEDARAEAERLRRALEALEAEPRVVRTSSGRVPRGTRSAQLLQVVADRPGITQREVADAVGVPGAAVYAWVRRAVLKGQIAKEASRLYPVERSEMAA